MAQQQQFQPASHLFGIDKPTVWNFLTPLAVETGSTNMAHGFPNWAPPKYLMERYSHHIKNGNQQYCRAFGHPRLVTSIANFYSKFFQRTIDPLKEVVVQQGATGVLFSIFAALFEKGDEFLMIDPSYDCYRGEVQICGGKCVSVPLIQNKNSYKSKEQIKKELAQGYDNSNEDLWDVDWEQLNLAINEKTRAILVNTIHNPTGKVFKQWELEKIAKLIEKHPRIVVIDDRAYEVQVYGKVYGTLDNPRMANLPGMWDRTITVYSAGKQYSLTGARVGWAIGPNHYIKYMQGVTQYNLFGIYEPIQQALADTMDHFAKEGEWDRIRKDAQMKRDHLLAQLAESKLNIKIGAPQGGFFLTIDTTDVEVPEKFWVNKQGEKLTKDYAFCNWLALEFGVVCAPCSYFFNEERTKPQGYNMVRVAICKTMETITETGRRLRGLPRQKL